MNRVGISVVFIHPFPPIPELSGLSSLSHFNPNNSSLRKNRHQRERQESSTPNQISDQPLRQHPHLLQTERNPRSVRTAIVRRDPKTLACRILERSSDLPVSNGEAGAGRMDLAPEQASPPPPPPRLLRLYRRGPLHQGRPRLL